MTGKLLMVLSSTVIIGTNRPFFFDMTWTALKKQKYKGAHTHRPSVA
jgi:hypothetical protein